MPPLAEEIFEKYPFLSLVTYGGAEYVGIVQNQDDTVLSMYDYSKIPDELKTIFLELGDVWWWESNRMIPINIFLRDEMAKFKHAIMTMNSKDVKVTIGPCVNLHNLTIKRVKRKSVQLVRKSKD